MSVSLWSGSTEPLITVVGSMTVTVNPGSPALIKGPMVPATRISTVGIGSLASGSAVGGVGRGGVGRFVGASLADFAEVDSHHLEPVDDPDQSGLVRYRSAEHGFHPLLGEVRIAQVSQSLVRDVAGQPDLVVDRPHRPFGTRRPVAGTRHRVVTIRSQSPVAGEWVIRFG